MLLAILEARNLSFLISNSDRKEIQPVHSEGDQPWDFFGRNDAKAETPVLWPPHAKSWLIGKDWRWEELGAGGEGDDRGWDGWMASLTRWTWVWVNSRSWWWTGRPGVLRFMGSQRVGHDWATDLIWSEWEYAVQGKELNSVFCGDLDGWDGGGWEGGLRARIYIYIYIHTHTHTHTHTHMADLGAPPVAQW